MTLRESILRRYVGGGAVDSLSWATVPLQMVEKLPSARAFARAILTRYEGAARREEACLARSYLPAAANGRKSLRESTFFKYPPGTCSRENSTGIFIATVAAAAVVSAVGGANLLALIERTAVSDLARIPRIAQRPSVRRKPRNLYS